MTDDLDVSLRRRLEGLAAAVPVSPPGEVSQVTPRAVRAGSGVRLGFAGLLPILALVVGGTLFAAIARLGPFASGTDAPASDGFRPSNGPVEASSRSGDFILTIRSPLASYVTGDTIKIEASLTYDGSEPITIAHGYGGAGGPVGFGIEEPVLGGLRLAPTTAEVCARTALEPGQTLRYAFAKSGGFDGHDPHGDDYKRFFEDPQLVLTVGTWHIYAVADFSIGDCADPIQIRAELTIEVAPGPNRTDEPTLAPATDGPVIATDRDGDFELTLRSAKATYRSDEAIDITASLTYRGSESTIRITHDDAGPLMFSIREKVFGAVQVGGISDLMCSASTLERGVALTSSFVKTGGYSNDDPDAEAFHDWLLDPVLRLPPGTWHVAVASSSPCMSEGPSFSVRSEITIVVSSETADPPPSPEGSPDLPAPIDAERVEGSAILVLLDVIDGDCIGHGIADFIPPDLEALDRLIDARNEADGLYVVREREFALGSLELAAALLGGQRLVVGSDGPWILIAPGAAAKLGTIDTPAGHLVWAFDGESASYDDSCGA